MFGIDIYLLEALIDGLLLGGVLALLALGLNLIFGVIDVVWICYVELIMLGMYGMYYMFVVFHMPFLLDASGHSAEWSRWLESAGFRKERPFMRMFRGTAPRSGMPECQFAIAGPEFG